MKSEQENRKKNSPWSRDRIVTLRDALERQMASLEKHPNKLVLFKHGKNAFLISSCAEKAAPILERPILGCNMDGVILFFVSFPLAEREKYISKIVAAGMKTCIYTVPRAAKGEVCDFDLFDQRQKEFDNVGEKVGDTSLTQATAKSSEEVRENNDIKVKEETKVRAPQMITANGEKVTHAHFFQSRDDVSKWFFTARIDGVQLHLKVADPEDLAFAQRCKAEGKPFPVEELMNKYYPTKMAAKVAEKDFSLPLEIQGAKGVVHTVTKLHPYKEKNVGYTDFGKWKLYACVNGKSLSIVPSPKIMSGYFDRTMSLKEIMVGAFGEKLQLPEAYSHFHKPDGLGEGAARVHKVCGDDKHWYVSARLGENLSTPAKPISFDDAGSFFAKAVTADQLADKYLSKEIESALAKKNEMTQEVSNTKSLKI